MNQSDFPDGAVLVFGGSGGIGSAIGRRFAGAGIATALTYRHSAESARAIVADIEAAGGEGAAIAADVTDRLSVDQAVSVALARFGRIHTAVFAAGALPDQRYIAEFGDEEWRRAIEVETHGFYHVVRALLPHFRDQSGGSFVHIGSAGDVAWANRDGLSVIPKAANEALVRGVAREEGRYGIRANSVLVGVVEAGMFLEFQRRGVFDAEWIERTHRTLAIKRFGKPEEIGDAALFLASDRAAYITGQRLAVAGGYGL